jgi:hypothetical protein
MAHQMPLAGAVHHITVIGNRQQELGYDMAVLTPYGFNQQGA